MFHVKQYAMGRQEEVSLPGDMRLRTNIFHNVILDVNAPSSRVTTFPSDLYGFVTIFNNTRFDFILIKGVVDNPLEIIGACPAYTLLTFPIDRSISNVFIRWGGTAGITERCKIFFTEENLGLVGQFRPPALVLGTTPDRIIFNGVASVTTLVTATQKIIIRSIYIVNTAVTASTITIAHRISGTNRDIVSNISIPANTTHALGYLVLMPNNDLRITAFTGTINILIYGEGI